MVCKRTSLRLSVLALSRSGTACTYSLICDNNAGGENISSVSLESMLAEHPDILEVGVVAVSDSHWGERPKAFITVKEGKKVQGSEVIEWAKRSSEISKFMVPREVEVIDELPKTSTGKVQKNVLRERVKAVGRVN